MAIPTSKQIEEFRQHAGQLIDEATRDMRHLVVEDHAQHLAAALIYCTIIQSAHECFALLGQPTITVAGILRGTLESYADLCAVIDDPKYPERMLATFYVERIRYLNSMIAFPTNAYHADVRKQIDPAKELTKAESELNAIADRGYVPLSNKQRLEAGHLLDEYQSLYWQLCLESHNSISALEDRHIENEDGKIGLVLRKDNTPQDLARYYDALVGIVLEASIRIHKLMRTGIGQKYEELSKELRLFREGLGAGL